MQFVDFLGYSFVERAYLAGSFVAILCAMLGMFLVLRKLSLIGDGLSHVSFGAIALGLFFGVYPLYVAVPVVVLASLFILKLTEKAKLYGDAAIGIVSSVGIAVGVILASVSSGFNVDLFSYLFGNILAISFEEVVSAMALSVAVLAVILLFYNDLFSATFDSTYARMTGVNVERINVLLTVLTAVTVVLATKVVGIMLVSALLVLPAVTALQVARGFKAAMVTAIAIAVLSVIGGITISFFLNIPTGATIILANFSLFVLSWVYSKF